MTEGVDQSLETQTSNEARAKAGAVIYGSDAASVLRFFAWIQLVLLGIGGSIFLLANYGFTGHHPAEANPLGIVAASALFLSSIGICAFLLAIASIAENLAHLRRHIAGGRFSEN